MDEDMREREKESCQVNRKSHDEEDTNMPGFKKITLTKIVAQDNNGEQSQSYVRFQLEEGMGVFGHSTCKCLRSGKEGSHAR